MLQKKNNSQPQSNKPEEHKKIQFFDRQITVKPRNHVRENNGQTKQQPLGFLAKTTK